MDNKYDPSAIEQKWYQIWEQKGYFTPNHKGKPYCIVIPPPNVTGTLHMGHGFQQSIMDALIRYHRMLGDNTLWQVGTDHAGIATQMVVENQLAAEKTSRHDLGREAFLKRIWHWKDSSGAIITKQERRLGISADWTRERFTLDPDLAKTVEYVFIKLYDEGLIYRGKRLVNWDPVLKTAISDLEVINEEREGLLYYIRYPLVASQEKIIIATTRPETLLGDVAVAVHPDDSRYKHLLGKMIKLPLTDRLIPIISDPEVVKDFGTGCVKITPAHDFTDYAIGLRHDLDQINILTNDAHLNDQVPTKYQGLDRFEARIKILEDLKAARLLIKAEKHISKIPLGDRSGAIIEPMLTNQWYVNAKVLTEPAIEVVKSGKIKFIPENWSKTYFNWLENIQDWCISRQLWWGHRIPAWYDEQGNVYVGHGEKEIRSKYSLSNITLTQDEDVLDTWFSSALWPFSTLGWPEHTNEYQTFYPTNVLVTGFDIIFFWVARMIMMGLKFTSQVPFREVYITGLIRDSKGQKMSKSKGNIIDPVDLIDGIALDALIAKRTSNLMQQHLRLHIENITRLEFPQGIPPYGTDALRFTFCALATTGRDINFDLSRLEGYRNFCTKIWNATRYVLMQTEGFNSKNPQEFTLADHWIRSRLNKTIRNVTNEFANYRFDLATTAIYDFAWHEFCDWYLELTKSILTDDSVNAAQKNGTKKTLLFVLESLLKLIHPFMPFITEELWQQVAPKLGITGPTIMLQPYPSYDENNNNDIAENEIVWLKKIILAIRNIRGEINLGPNKLIAALFYKGTKLDRQRLNNLQNYLLRLAKLESTHFVTELPKAAMATALIDELEIHIPMANLIDKKAEIIRLTKEIAKLEKDIAAANNKFNNPHYLEKAPPEVVAKEKIRLEENSVNIMKLKNKISELEKI